MFNFTGFLRGFAFGREAAILEKPRMVKQVLSGRYIGSEALEVLFDKLQEEFPQMNSEALEMEVGTPTQGSDNLQCRKAFELGADTFSSL
jgi:hypothetical protein